MCPPNPFPLAPVCAHVHDKLDQAIVIFLINNEVRRYSIRELEGIIISNLSEYKNYTEDDGIDLLRRRLNLLEKEGLTDKLNGWLWTATPKAKEAHCLWLWSNVANVA